MLKIELIRFEAQDVITASGVKCTCNTMTCGLVAMTGGKVHAGCDADVHKCGVEKK